MKVLFVSLIGFGITAASVAVGLSLGGECLPLGSTSVEVACHTPGEEAGAILTAIAFLRGPPVQSSSVPVSSDSWRDYQVASPP